MSNFRSRLAGVIGNFLEHYDNALFGMLAPFIAPLFFEKSDPITALILTYGMLPLGFVTRPIGSLVFGWIGDRFGRRQALFYSLVGMAVVTMGMGFLPLYCDIGIWSPVLLALARMLQSFFASGEGVGGAIFVLEHTEEKKRSWMSGCYDASTIAGILLASGLVTLMVSRDMVQENWRSLFWIGGLTALFGLFVRWKTNDSREFTKSPERQGSYQWSVLKSLGGPFLAITLASGFSYTTYSLAFTLMNGYIPLVTSLSSLEVMNVNTILLVFDMCLLPLFGFVAHKWGKEKLMLTAALAAAASAIPLFSLLQGADLWTVILVRVGIVVCGVAFAAPYYAWAMEQVVPRHRYMVLSLGGVVGSQLIGMPCSAICLWLYKVSGWSGAPGIYLVAIGSSVSMMVWARMRRSSLQKADCRL